MSDRQAEKTNSSESAPSDRLEREHRSLAYANSDLRHANAELRAKIAQLQQENAKLLEREKLATQQMVEYLQNVSHQLVAPLNAIKWHIENLTGSRISFDRARKVMRSVYSQATLAVHLAKNFKLMSNLEQDQALSALKEPLQEIDLCQLLVNLADDFQSLAWDQDIQIKVDKEKFTGCPKVLGMKPLVSQVFSNIIENAVKYSNAGTTILISASFQNASPTIRVDDTSMVRVDVRSKGVILRPEDGERIFERGFRTPEGKAKYPAGTGFGLFIARRIVENHEGRIKATGDAQGTVTFSVYLSVRGLHGKARIRESR